MQNQTDKQTNEVQTTVLEFRSVLEEKAEKFLLSFSPASALDGNLGFLLLLRICWMGWVPEFHWGLWSPVESRWVPLSPAESCWPSSHEALNNSYCCTDPTKHTHVPLSSSVRLLNNWGLTIPSSRINSPIKLLFWLVSDSFECLFIKKPHIQTYKSDWFHSAAPTEFGFWVLAVVAECAKQSCT